MLVYLNSPVMLGSYLQQTTTADDFFRSIFQGALRVKPNELSHPYKLEESISNFRVAGWYLFSFVLILTYVVGAQKNRLIETVLLGTHNICFV